jgi:hypothetical protein
VTASSKRVKQFLYDSTGEEDEYLGNRFEHKRRGCSAASRNAHESRDTPA